MGNRHSNYEKRVAAFIATNGPKFTLAQVSYSDLPGKCQCCGYHPINNWYHVVGSTGRFVIGSECQELVLGFADAHMPAARVRVLSKSELQVLAVRYGLTLDADAMTTQELAAEVIKARRAKANVEGWVSRRRQKQAVVAIMKAV